MSASGPPDGWKVSTGFVDTAGEIRLEQINPMAVEMIHAFPHRAAMWVASTDSTWTLVSFGAIDDVGDVIEVERFADPRPGQYLVVLVDLLGIDAEALS